MRRPAGWFAGAAGALGSFLWVACGCARESDGVAAPAVAGMESDRRVQEILGSCNRADFYDRELSDIVPVLLEKLERARPDPLKRAKEELGALGSQAFPGLANAFHANYGDVMRSAFLENVIDALAFSATDESHELLLEALQHPQESVRAKALDGLLRQVRPEDFALLAQRLAIETREVRRQTVALLFRADRARAEDLFLSAMERGEERDLWIVAVPEFAAVESREGAGRCGALFAAQDATLAPYLAAGAARHGDAQALAFLRAAMDSDDLQRRLTAVHALERAGLVDELLRALREDPAAEIRAIAASALAEAPGDEARREGLRAALSDPSEVVQAAALSGLCSQGDTEGLARALAQLEGHVGLLQNALLALRDPLRKDPALARNAFERLLQRHALEEHRPLAQRTATFKAIGQIPLPAAAEFLHRLGIAAGAETIESLRAHDWLMIQASNTDVAGRGFLAEALRQEQDPLRRLDLIDAVGSTRDDLARSVLLAVVEQEARSPLERLFAAHALIKIGPSWEVAPRLKRVAYAMQGPDEARARAVLQCLLWQWY